MNKKIFSLIINIAIATIPGAVFSASKSYENSFFSANPSLTREERHALAIAKKWQAGSSAYIKPVASTNGAVLFVYGTQQASIVCAVLQVCDVALQAGESVNSIHLGDTHRWTVEPALTGYGSNEIQHLIIKPLDVGLETSLVVTTNRRTYHLKIRSHRRKYMPKIAFTYPEETMHKWNLIRSREKQERVINTIAQTGEYLGELSFKYEVEGNASWKPERVYNNGKKTIIQMPEKMAQRDAPTLLLLKKEEGFFSDEETAVVNYRVQNNRYIVDAIFDRAILISGVGSDQERILITKGE